MGMGGRRLESLKFDASWIDLVTIILLVYMFMTVALATAIREEIQTQVNLLKKKAQTNSQAFGPETPKLSIVPDGQKGYRFVLESQKLGKLEFSSVKGVVAELERLRPQALVLRVDQNTPFRYPQEIMIAAKDLGIRLGLAYIKRK
ncbi:hypothetical protein TDIS_1228 [Thermosulfurimonas dismutans]|uniref:Biopolymer transporter ExbD n=2 Tax=Thermosulfurimonas dismutans TaxID=999894 RepID=A0A179D3Q2_9BACT|nr:hypothetical protein TDIS_1228 [Thermosulfurimonas dismutans]